MSVQPRRRAFPVYGEDITGPDEFYVVSALEGGKTKAVTVTEPISINTNQTKLFPDKDRSVFAGTLPEDGFVEGGMVAYDEDFGVDWNKKYKIIVESVAEALAKNAENQKDKDGKDNNNPLIPTLIRAVAGAFGLLAQSDVDDVLGRTVFRIPAKGPAEETIKWSFSHEDGIGFSDWSYVVTYRVMRE